MFHLKPHVVGPLKQKKNNISFHLIQGKLEITIFNKKQKISLSNESKNPSHIGLKLISTELLNL